MRGHFECDFFGIPPFGRHFGPGACSRGRHPFGMPGWSDFRDFRGHHCRKPEHGPDRHGFDHSPERHGPGHHGPEHHQRGPGCGRRGSPERHCRGSPERDWHGPPKRHCHGPPGCGRPAPPEHDHHDHHGFGHGPSTGPRGHSHGPHDHSHGPHGHSHGPHGHSHGPHGHSHGPHGPRSWLRHSPGRHCFGRRGPPDSPDRPCGGPDRHSPGFGRHGPCRPWFGHRRPGPYDGPERGPQRNTDCEECRQNEPCCSDNKENRASRRGGRKENGPCCEKNKEQNPTEDTVLVQRIVVEAPRPQSV